MLETIARRRGVRAIANESFDQYARLRILEAAAGQLQGKWSRMNPPFRGLEAARAHYEAQGLEVEPEFFVRKDQKVYFNFLRGIGAIRGKFRSVIKDQKDVEDIAATTIFSHSDSPDQDPFGKIGKTFRKDPSKMNLATARKWAATQGAQRAMDHVRSELSLQDIGGETNPHHLSIGPGGVHQFSTDSEDRGQEIAAPSSGAYGDAADLLPALLESHLGDKLKVWLMRLWERDLTPATRTVAELWLEDPNRTQRDLASLSGTSQGSAMRFYRDQLPKLLQKAQTAIEAGKAPSEVQQMGKMIGINEAFRFAAKRKQVVKKVATRYLQREFVNQLRLSHKTAAFRDTSKPNKTNPTR